MDIGQYQHRSVFRYHRMSLAASKNDKCMARCCMIAYVLTVSIVVLVVVRNCCVPINSIVNAAAELAEKTLTTILAWQSLTHSRFSCFCICLVHGRYLFPDILQPLALHDDRMLFVFELLPQSLYARLDWTECHTRTSTYTGGRQRCLFSESVVPFGTARE